MQKTGTLHPRDIFSESGEEKERKILFIISVLKKLTKNAFRRDFKGKIKRL